MINAPLNVPISAEELADVIKLLPVHELLVLIVYHIFITKTFFPQF